MNAPEDFDDFDEPKSIEAEQCVLGGLILDGERFHDLSVREAHFYRADHRAIFSAIASLVAKRHPVDSVTVCDELESRGELQAVGGLEYIAALAQNTPSAANIRRYAEIVFERAAERAMLAASADLAELATMRDGRSLIERQALAAQIIEAATIQAVGDDRCTVSVADASRQALAMMQARMDLPEGTIGGLPSGLKLLDERLDGLHDEELIIVGGRPSMGKSVLADCFARAALAIGKKVRIQSYEMPACDIALRQIAAGTGIPYSHLRYAKPLTDEQYTRLTAFTSKQLDWSYTIDDDSGATVDRIVARARRQKRREGLDLLIVDHLHLIPTRGSENRAQALGDITSTLKRLARELKIPVVLVCQLNRDGAKNGGREPVLSDLRDSGNIEQDADVVLFPHRPHYYDEKQPEDLGMILTRKQRNGPIGSDVVGWNGPMVRFENARTGADFVAREVKPHWQENDL